MPCKKTIEAGLVTRRQKAFARILVVAQPEENRLAQFAIASPFGKRDLRHQLGRRPRHTLLAWWIDERCCRARDRLEHPIQFGEALLGKPGADFSYKVEIIAPIGAEQQRPDMLPRALRSGVPGNDEFLLLMHLDLQPCAAAAFLVGRGEVLRDEALEVAPFRDSIRLESVVGEPL